MHPLHAIASLFRMRRNFSRSSSWCSSDDGGVMVGCGSGRDDDDDRTAVGFSTNGGGGQPRLSLRRLESRESANARRAHGGGGGGFVGWLWRAVMRQQAARQAGRPRGTDSGRRSPASSSGSVEGASPLPLRAARASVRNGEGKEAAGLTGAAAAKASNSQQRPQLSIGHSLPPRISAWRPKSASVKNGSRQGQQQQRRSGPAGVGCGSIVGGCISQFYDPPAMDEEDTMEISVGGGGGCRKVPSPEEEAEERARVQQLLRTSQVHMNKYSSMRSGSFGGDFSGGGTAAAAAPFSTVAAAAGGAGH